jgi:hypothetical protein
MCDSNNQANILKAKKEEKKKEDEERRKKVSPTYV